MTKLEQGVRNKTSEQWLVVVVVVRAAPHSHNDTETKTSLMPLASWELVKSTSATLGPIKRAAWLLSFIVDGITNKVQFTCFYPQLTPHHTSANVDRHLVVAVLPCCNC